ncbi:MAG: GFA family protein [Nitratireductor sp.]|nr:GFA family protein [Nitratireductor sp.]
MHFGRCLCGEIEYAVEGQPRDVVNCHCEFCQRATGSAYLVETIFEQENFRLLHGEPGVYRHMSAGSGKQISIYFCAICGTKTHMTFDCFPKIVGVYSGTFDEKDWFERTRENTLHFFLSTAPKGTVLPAGFEIYDAHYWQSDGVPAEPSVFEVHTLVTDALRAESRRRLDDPKA